jgi:hypothetical protein
MFRKYIGFPDLIFIARDGSTSISSVAIWIMNIINYPCRTLQEAVPKKSTMHESFQYPSPTASGGAHLKDGFV